MSRRTLTRLVVTGAGVVSAAGCSMASLAASLRRQRHCLTPITTFDATGLAATHAGQVGDFAPLDGLPPAKITTLDRATQMAVNAARQALKQAALPASILELTGVGVGTSGSPQYQNMQLSPDNRPPASRLAALYLARSTPSFQADIVARLCGLTGPRFAFGSASLGGMLAISHAMDLLRAGHAPAMLVGGGEIHSLMNALGMNTLGVATAGPCTPFAGTGGMCFGEGAAFFVVECLSDSAARGAKPLAEVLGTGISADAYNEVAQDPTGRGLARAVRKSLAASNVDRAGIGWVRACGTGQRDLDNAEALALQTVFGDAMPPVTSTEPYFGHTNGVSPLLGLAAVVASLQTDQSPCLPERAAARPGLTPPLLQPGKLPDAACLLTATAFGGTNGALVVQRACEAGATEPACREATPSRIVIAGMGAVSPFGGTLDAFLSGLASETLTGEAIRKVDDAWLSRRLPGVMLQRRLRLVRMVLLAVHEALSSAGVATPGTERVGLLVGLTRGPMAAYERFLEQIAQGGFHASTGRSMLRAGRFSVASEIAQAFGLVGYSGAMAAGVHGGVHTLAHGAEILRGSLDLDALLVVAADEWTPLLEAQYRRLGLLRDSATDPAGCKGGEGAAAVLLRRQQADDQPKIGQTCPGQTSSGQMSSGQTVGWAKIDAIGFAGDATAVPDPAGRAYSKAIRTAIKRAGHRPEDIGFGIGQGCGWPAYDNRERSAFARVCPDTSLTSLAPHTGLLESAGGLFGAMAAAASLRARPDQKPCMLISSTERGAHAAVVLSRIAA